MERPHCNICGTKHWPSEPHKFAKPASDTAPLEPTRVHEPSGPAEETAPETAGAKELSGPKIEAPKPGEACPTCGHRRAMTSAGRVRRHRARKHE